MKIDNNEGGVPRDEDSIFGSRRLTSILNPASLSFALIGLLITTFAASALYQAQRETLETRFSSDTGSIHRLLKARLDSGVRLVETGGAFLKASGDVTDAQWSDFLGGMDLETDLPGLQGIGYARAENPSGGKWEEQIPPDSSESGSSVPEDSHTPVILFENLAANGGGLKRGRDFASTLSLREATAKSLDTGKCSITIAPGSCGPGKPAFIFCLPLFEKGANTSTAAHRREAIQGFVFAPFEVAELIENIFIGSERHIGLRLVDENALPGTPPVFTSSQTNPAPTFQSASDLQLGGRFWRVETFSLASFENRRMRLSSLFIALSGIAITLLGMMILSDLRAKQERAARIAENSAESLKKSEAEIREMNAGLEKAVAVRTARLAEANDELRTFSYTVSHDLRAPARHVEALAGFLVEEHGDELSPGANEYLTRISESAVRMQSLIEDILKLAGCSNAAFHPRRIDLTSLATELAATFECLYQNRRIQVEIEPDLELIGDPTVVRTTMQNLLDNAFKFTARRETAIISIGAVTHNGKQFYYVRDNGTGFDMKQAESIFQPFKRLHRESDFEGSGVGLATVRKMIRRHGGEIRVDSVQGTGTTFFFHLDTDEEITSGDNISPVTHHRAPGYPAAELDQKHTGQTVLSSWINPEMSREVASSNASAPPSDVERARANVRKSVSAV